MSEEQRRGQLALELKLPEGHINGATFAPLPGSTSGLFSCSIGPLSENAVRDLERAAHLDTPIRLCFSEYPLLLAHVTVERKGPQAVRIVGQIIRSGTA